MNQDLGTTNPDTNSSLSAGEYQSDHDSVSASSEQHDFLSSADTTPPPQTELFNPLNGSGCHSLTSRYKRYSSGTDQGLSNSHQSNSSINSWAAHEYVSESPGLGDHSTLNRKGYLKVFPSSAIGRDQEDEVLASAVQLLSCSFGSTGTPLPPKSLTSLRDNSTVSDIPVLYLDQSDFITSVFSSSHHPRQNESYTRARIYDNEDVEKKIPARMKNDDEVDQRSPYRSDEDEDGVFGRMEE